MKNDNLTAIFCLFAVLSGIAVHHHEPQHSALATEQVDLHDESSAPSLSIPAPSVAANSAPQVWRIQSDRKLIADQTPPARA